MGVGVGHSAMTDWSSVMNLPKSSCKSAYQNTKSKIHEGCSKTCEDVMKQSAMLVREKYAEMGVKPDEDDILNTSVSFDG